MQKNVEYKIDKIADWIVNGCGESRDEVKWLLEQIYIPSNNRIQIDFDKVICPKIEDDYDGVFEHLNNKKESK